MASPNPPFVTGAWIKDSAGSDVTLVNPMPVEQVGTVNVNIVGGGSGGAVTIADGADVAEGAKADPPATTATTDPWTVVSLLKGLLKVFLDVWNGTTHALGVTFTNTTIAVTGTFYQATQPSSPVASTTGGATPYHYIAAAAANQDSTVVKASAGQLYSIAGMCAVATPRFAKLYDKATAPTSSDTPVQTLMIPANGTTGAGFAMALPIGLKFTNGIAFRLTTGLADSDTGACTAGDCVFNLGWI